MGTRFKMARFLLSFVAVIIAISGLTIYFWWRFVSGPVDLSNSQKILVVIPKGSSAAEVGMILAEKGIIKDPFVFRLASQVKGDAARILAGAYKLSPDHSLFEVLKILEKGPSDFWVTIPEGFRREQIALRFASSMSEVDKSFDTKEFLSLTQNLEGRLFPDTYLIPQDLTPAQASAILTANFLKRTTDILRPPYPDRLTAQQVIVLASIIERETKDAPGERPLVAGILLKRLKNNWPLQADATLQFIRDDQMVVTQQGLLPSFEFWKPALSQDKKLVSAINTYLHPGLPPVAISNPGLSAINAAMRPQDSPYWYYIHGSDGTIHFAATIEEHQTNIQRYL